MHCNVLGRTRGLLDCIPEVQTQEQLQQQQLSVTLLRTSKASTLAARLGLTGRYQVRKPTELILERLHEAQEPMHKCALAANGSAPPDFKAAPLSSILLDVTLGLLEALVLEERTSLTHQTLASLTHKILHDYAALDCEKEDPEGTEVSCSDGQAFTTALQLVKHLCGSLTHRTYTTLTAWLASHAARERSMSNSRQPFTTHISDNTFDTAVRDTRAIVLSSDFPVLCLGTERSRGDNLLDITSAAECTTKLLRIRLLLRSQPFLVVCEGPAHMGAFFELAEQTELHLELLPTSCHRQSMCR